MPISPLQEVSQTYERSVDQSVDQVMVAHGWAMICHDVEELIVVGLGLFESYEQIASV